METEKFKKLMDAARYLLSRNGGRLNYTKLIKLLYLADRKHLQLYDSPITGDSYVSMKMGPVLSSLFDLLKEKSKDARNQVAWNLRFETISNDVLTTTRPDYPSSTGELSRAEKITLSSVDDEFKKRDYRWMVDYVHELPEWQSPPSGSMRALPLEAILRALGKDEDHIRFILGEMESYEKEDKLFARLRDEVEILS